MTRRTRRQLAKLVVLLLLAPNTPAQRLVPPGGLPPAREPDPAEDVETVSDGDQEGGGLRLKLENATLDIVLRDYAAKIERTILEGPGLPNVTINLRSHGDLTLEEYLQAVESVLSMNGIAILKVGEKFLKVIPNQKARQEGMQISDDEKALEKGETDELISQLVPLKHIDINEAQKAIESFKHPFGQVQLFERINSILVTDTLANIKRIVQVLSYIDQQVVVREEPNVVVIKFARASEIKQKLEEIIAEAQKEVKPSTVPRAKTTGSPGFVQPRRPGLPGLSQLRPRTVGPAAEPATVAEIIEMAEKGIIHGRVKIVADDRTNRLIIITRKENMQFFEKIIGVLDVEISPEVTVRNIRLEYAEAKDVATTLNELIGAISREKEEVAARAAAAPDEATGRSAALRDFAEMVKRASGKEPEKSEIGQLSSKNLKILADERTNSLIIMGRKGDIEALEDIIHAMDIMLSQVMIEAVIIQVDLDRTVSSGVHWVQRAVIAYKQRSNGSREALGMFAGRGGGGGTALGLDTLASAGSWATGSGLTMYFRHFGLSLDAIVNMLQSDSRTQILSSPVIVTEDNTEAVLSSSAQKYFLKGSTVDQFGNVRPETEIRDIGLDLTVKPHINEQGAVMMEISQKVSDEGAPQKISDELGEFPTTQTRSFKASITVQNGETIVLGGLVRKSRLRSNAGIPLLSSIPLFGRLFSAKSDSKSRSEVVVFVTPYVLNTGEQIREESARRKEALDIKGLWRRGWSGSRLADPAPKRLFWRSGGNRTEPAARSPEAGGNRTGVQDRSGTEPDA